MRDVMLAAVGFGLVVMAGCGVSSTGYEEPGRDRPVVEPAKIEYGPYGQQSGRNPVSGDGYTGYYGPGGTTAMPPDFHRQFEPERGGQVSDPAGIRDIYHPYNRGGWVTRPGPFGGTTRVWSNDPGPRQLPGEMQAPGRVPGVYTDPSRR